MKGKGLPRIRKPFAKHVDFLTEFNQPHGPGGHGVFLVSVFGCCNEILWDEWLEGLPVKPIGNLSQNQMKAAARLDSGAQPAMFEKLTTIYFALTG
jgi:hypothetical protein